MTNRSKLLTESDECNKTLKERHKTSRNKYKRWEKAMKIYRH